GVGCFRYFRLDVELVYYLSLGVQSSRCERVVLVWAGRSNAAVWQHIRCARRAGLQRRQRCAPRRLWRSRIVDSRSEENRKSRQLGDSCQILGGGKILEGN